MDCHTIPEVWRGDFGLSLDHARDERFAVPLGSELVSFCEENGFPARATDLLVESRHTWDDRTIERLGAHFQWLVLERYQPDTYMSLGFPPAPRSCPLFYAYALIGLAGPVSVAQARTGIDPAVTRATLADIGQQVAIHDRLHADSPFALGWWLTHHLSGHLFRIGRLQFQRSILGVHHGDELEGQLFLDVHIPQGESLDPNECDRSFADAAAFFARHFATDHARWFGCTSWLLDAALVDLLAPESNLLAFQRRFRSTRVDVRESSRVFEFVFERPDLDELAAPDLDRLAVSTRLQRNIIELYRSGGRIRAATGLIEIADSQGQSG